MLQGSGERRLVKVWWFWVCIGLVVFLLFWFLGMPIGDLTSAALVETAMSIVLAALSTITIISVAKQFTFLGTRQGLVMSTMAVGFAAWAIAEAIWFSNTLSGAELFPSWADVFWIFGYLPIVVALSVNARSIRTKFSGTMLAAWIALSLVVALIILSIDVIPLIAEDSSFETIVTVTYPIEDILVIVPVLVILLKFRSGEVALPWAVLTIGFLLTALGDVWYSYAEYSGTYGEAYNAVDLFLLLGYVAFLFGGLLFRRLYQTQSVTE